MPERRELVCLANSRKRSGRCVAGFDREAGAWIRPITDTEDGTVPTSRTILDNSQELQVLDLFEVELERARPDEIQPENHVLSGTTWTAAGRLGATEAIRLLEEISDPGPELFGSTGDRVAPDDLREAPDGSLTVVELEEVRWELETGFYNRPRLRAHFRLSGQSYDLVVTDVEFFRRFSGWSLGYYGRDTPGIGEHDRIWFTVSLTEPFEATGDCFKLVAAVICIPGS